MIGGDSVLPENLCCFPYQLRLLIWERYPLRCMPTPFPYKNLVKLKMQKSKLEKLWEGAVAFTCLKELDMWGSQFLKEIPDLSKATNLVKLNFGHCWSLVELPSSIRNLDKLVELNMEYCELETLPTGFNLESLYHLNFNECCNLRTFPEFATNIAVLTLAQTSVEIYPSSLYLKNLVELSMGIMDSDEKKWQGEKFTPFMPMLSPNLTILELWNVPSLVELPSSFLNLHNLENLSICYCRNLETLPTGINLESLVFLYLFRCSRLRSFPDISTNISKLDLDQTGIEEVPGRIENFFNLSKLMKGCSKLKCVSMNISKLKHLREVDFSECGALIEVDLSGYPSDTVSKETCSSLPDSCVPDLNFMDCFNLKNKDALIQQQSITFNSMILPGEEVPSYFTHRTTDSQSMFDISDPWSPCLTIPLLPTQLSHPFFRFRACAVISASNGVYIQVDSRFKGRFGNSFDYFGEQHSFMDIRKGVHLCIFDCSIPLYKDNAPLTQRNYDHVDMKIRIIRGWKSAFEFKGLGIRLLECSSSPENQHGNPNSTLPHVSEAEEGNLVSGNEQGDINDVVMEKSSKHNGDALLLRRSTDSMFSTMSGKEVILYFNHRTTVTSLTNVPLPHVSLSQPFFRFNAFAVVDCQSSGQFSYFGIYVSCWFKDRFGNHFDCPYRPRRFYKTENGIRLDIYECYFPLNQDNTSLAEVDYDHVDIKLHLRYRSDSKVSLVGWGIRLIEDSSSPENQLVHPNTPHHVCEADGDNTVNDGGHETDQSEERGNSDDSETDQFEECENSDKDNEIDQSEKFEDTDDSGIGIEIDQSEERGDSDDSDIDSENDQFEECGESNEIDQSEVCGDSDDNGIGIETDQFEECENSN